MEIINRKVSELIPYDRNPRNNDEAVKYVKASIEQFGFKVPIVIDEQGVIVAGHTRVKAAKELGMKEVPCIVADDLTEEQIKAFRLADNKTAEIAEWDIELLNTELLDLEANFDMADFGFEIGSPMTDDAEKVEYSIKTDIPQYQITGEQPDISELYDDSKAEELLAEIEASDLSEDEKDFLRLGAQRHLVFDYRNIAEYYAHTSPQMQRMMEKSALVIIDLNDAIKNGYARFSEKIKSIMGEEDEE